MPTNLCIPYRVGILALPLALVLLFETGCTNSVSENKAGRNVSEPASEVSLPHSLVAEHEELKRMLSETIALGGETGAAAKQVEERLTPHFAKEEEYGLPSLTLLPDLAQGKSLSNAGEMIRRSEKMKDELPEMLNEHRSIVIALDQLAQVARKENREPALEFAEKLRLHARFEEEILYPAGIVAGQCAKLHLERGDRGVDTPR